MKDEELIKLREKFIQLQKQKNEILELKKEISDLEDLKEVKRYLSLIDDLNKKTKENKEFDKYTDEKLISIALDEVVINPDEEIYVYLGTYKYTKEIDIMHRPNDIEVKRHSHDADYVMYKNLESKYGATLKIPYKKANEFEEKHKIIIPQNVISNQRYFYELQAEYFETLILESKENANKKINRLIKKKLN